jgi:GH15 family glucan-1,4-alpha-glucosidase
MTYLLSETPFVLNRKPIHFVMGPDESLGEHPRALFQRFHEATVTYWKNYSRYLAIPPEWQAQVIRATITLKLCSLQDTGAIVAALTTSIPEYAGSGRNWDYRYCWLRDAYHVVQVLNRLGTTTTMERYLDYLSNLIAQHEAEAEPDALLQPCYTIGLESDLTEVVCTTLTGYRGMGPVRVGNGAYTQRQNDVYGSVIMACSQYFFDQRLENTGGLTMFERLEPLGQRAYELADKPDAGIWELRAIAQVHTHSAVSCWVACDRLAKIAAHLKLEDRRTSWRAKADEIRSNVLLKGWSEERQTFVSYFGGEEVDAVLLLLPELGFIEYTHPRFLSTLKVIESELLLGRQVMRYKHNDDFGYQRNAFNVWYGLRESVCVCVFVCVCV